MNFRQLHHFVTLAGELHFTRAAERLRVSQPALSIQIGQLETELGVRLFKRTKRNVQLTEAGSALLDRARLLLSDAEEAKIAAQKAERGESGRLVVSVAPDLAFAIPALVGEYLRVSGGVRIGLQELWSVDQVALLNTGVADIGILHLPIDERGLSIRPLRRDPLVIALPSGHPLAGRRSLAFQDLTHEPWVRIPPQPRAYGRDRFLELFGQAGFEPRVVAQATQIQPLLGLVAAGVGVCVLPQSAGRARTSGVVYRAIKGRPLAGQTAVAWRAGTEANGVVGRFLEIVERVIGQNSK